MTKVRILAFYSLATGLAWSVLCTNVQAETSHLDLSPDSHIRGAFSEIAEVQKSYSRALATYQAGRPEYAVELFRSAFEADNSFLLAKIAEMESYRALSLEDHAAVVKSQLFQQPGAGAFLQWVESRPQASGSQQGAEEPIQVPARMRDPVDFERGLAYTPELFAQALRHYSEDRRDRVWILRLYNAYHSRHWEHRIVLMQHLLTLLDRNQPADANWMSTALWRIRQEKYRRGAGYCFRPEGVETEFAELLAAYPASAAAACVRYSIALERASEGMHKEAAALLEHVIEVMLETKEIQVPCGYWTNLYFFAAREANLAGRPEAAGEYLGLAQEADQSWCQRDYPCLYSQHRREIPVVAAMGVNYSFALVCKDGPGWMLDTFTFGLDRSGRIFESGQVWWDSISAELESLVKALREPVTPPDSGPAIESILAQLDQQAFTSKADLKRGAVLREAFLAALLKIIQDDSRAPADGLKRTASDWHALFFRASRILQLLFKRGSIRWSRAELKEIGRRLSADCQRLTTGISGSANSTVLLVLAIEDYTAALKLLDQQNRKPDVRELCAESGLRGIAVRGLFGSAAEVQFYQERIGLLREMGFQDWIGGMDIFARAAKAARNAGLPKVAVEFCQQGITFLDDLGRLEEMKHEETRTAATERKASLMFLLGTLYEQLQDNQNAAATFRRIMEMTAGSNMNLYDPAFDYSGGTLRDNIFKLAAERLKALK